jgi:hypothetical protein
MITGSLDHIDHWIYFLVSDKGKYGRENVVQERFSHQGDREVEESERQDRSEFQYTLQGHAPNDLRPPTSVHS